MPTATARGNIDQGALVFTDNAGRENRYRRWDGRPVIEAPALHVVIEGDGDVVLQKALLDARTFPDDLFVQHPSPTQPPEGPVAERGELSENAVWHYVKEGKP